MKLLHCFALVACAGLSFVVGSYAQSPFAQDPSTVVAVVDGKNITLGEFRMILEIAPPNISQMIRVNPQTGLLAWFTSKHLAKEAEEMRLDQKSPWKEQIEAMRAQYLADARVNSEVNGYDVTSAMVRKWYEEHLNDYQRVRVSGVLIRFLPEAKTGATSTKDLEALLKGQLGNTATRSESDARKLAVEIGKRLRAGEDMKALVAQYSDDPVTKAKDGEIGWVSYTSSHEGEFRLAAMKLGKGDVSDPVALPGGFYVIRVEDRGASPLDEVSGEVNQEIRKVHMNEYITGVRNRFEPKIVNPGALVQFSVQGQK
jgi:hypothetical protein